MDERPKKLIPIMVAAGIGVGVIIACKKYNLIQKLQMAIGLGHPLMHQHVQVITTVEECKSVVARLCKETRNFKVLGFDCEWVTVDGCRRPVALLQLASQSGLCALFRLCHIGFIPPELQRILEDECILKVGVSPNDDAKYLLKDYGVNVKSSVDLRFITQLLNRPPEGLSKLSKTYLNVDLDKNWRIRCSSWDSKQLTAAQIDYAAKDCLVAVEIFKRLFDIYKKEKYGCTLDEFIKTAYCFANKSFKYKASASSTNNCGAANKKYG